MLENRKEIERARDDDSGVHLKRRPGWGTLGEELAERLTKEVGARVLARFPRLSRGDRAIALARATARLMETRLPATSPVEAHVRRAVFTEARRIDLGHFIDEKRADPDDVRLAFERAKRRLSLLTARERSVLAAVFTLDEVADEDEAGKVVLYAAIAHQMRWNTAHQNLSRAWRKLCENGLDAHRVDWRAAHRFICEPPSIELWTSARAYLDACGGRGAYGGPAFAEWTAAHEKHYTAFYAWKRYTQLATQAWRNLTDALEQSPLRPRDVLDSLLGICCDLGLDRNVVPTKVAAQSWHELLESTARPGPEARDLWRAFLWAHPFGAEVEIAFTELRTEAARADACSAELSRAYETLLGASERRSLEGVRAKDEFRANLAAARWT